MEHFEVHKEHLEDLIVDLDKKGPKFFADIPDVESNKEQVTIEDLALINEISGLTNFIDRVLQTNDVPEHVKNKISSQILRYDSVKPREIAMNELRIKLFGDI